MTLKMKIQEGTGLIKGGGVPQEKATPSPFSCLGICMLMEDQDGTLPMHMDESVSSQKSLEWKVGRSCLMPYAIVNDLSGDRKCSATQHNNQSALKLPASIHY